jgi:hypothetical protein
MCAKRRGRRFAVIHVEKSAENATSLPPTPGEVDSSVERRTMSAVRERSLPRLARRPGHAHRWITLALLLLGIELVYVFIVSAGKYVDWPTYNLNYDMQAEGFRKGHLYLPLEPPPELLEKENPLDPANSHLWFADLSFYKGKYYNYWGPLPALVLAAYKAVMNVASPVGDQYPVFILYSIYLVAGALLIDRMARRLFPGLPLYIVVLSIAVFAFANPTPYMIATPGIYEAAIGGSQAFLLVGLVFAFDSLSGERAFLLTRLLAAGVAWTLAIACRVSVGPAAALLVLFTALIPRPQPGNRWLAVIRNLLCLGSPMALGVFGLLYYNRARFDEWFEFGTNWMLNTVHIRASLEYVRPNLYSYFLRAPIETCQFPFFTVPWNMDVKKAFPADFPVPAGYWVQEPVVGMLPVVPWAWLVPLAAVYCVRAAMPRLGAPALPSVAAVRGSRLWCACSFAVIGTVTALPSIGVFAATMRYLADVAAGIVLFATWGAWSLHQHLRRKKWVRRAFDGGMTVLALATITLGLLVGYQGYIGHFQTYNPKLHERVTQAFSLCK